jgi:hypothetical protein
MNDKEERIWKEVVVVYEGIILTSVWRRGKTSPG